LREPSRRVRAAFVVVLGTTLLGGMTTMNAAAGHSPAGFERFMYALGQVESGGNYYAVNPTSGAYGKYQIMPYNWPVWAKKYIGSSSAPQTPANQEKVARGKVHDLHVALDRWRVVAHWWLTGSSSADESTWSDYSTRYVNKIMSIYNAGEAVVDTRIVVGDGNSRLDYDGRWGVARYPTYSADTIRWSNTKGAKVTLAFKGTSVAWIGPKGPTRGKARIYVDGTLVKTVDLYASSFRARNTIFNRSWKSAGSHSIRIEVLGTPGRPTVGVDEFRYAK
jgi:hypothetical protein